MEGKTITSHNKPIKSFFRKDNEDGKDVFHNNSLKLVKKEIIKQCDGPLVTDSVEAYKIYGETKRVAVHKLSYNCHMDDQCSWCDNSEDSRVFNRVKKYDTNFDNFLFLCSQCNCIFSYMYGTRPMSNIHWYTCAIFLNSGMLKISIELTRKSKCSR